jgi:hypothetical protein
VRTTAAETSVSIHLLTNGTGCVWRHRYDAACEVPVSICRALESPRMLAALSWFLAEDAATEGKKVITGMLITGLVFVAVIAIGELSHWARHRRR